MEALKFNVDKGFANLLFEESFITGYKGYALHKVAWMPETEPKAILMLVHDIGDHILRYKKLADYFTFRGIGVIGIDLRGHGKSEGQRGIAKYEDILHDTADLIRYTTAKYPYIPKFLYGNGLGGNLALYYSIRKRGYLQGLIVTSPWIRSYFSLAVTTKFSSALLARIFPFYTVSSKLNSKYLTHDLATNKQYNEDPLVHRRISPRLIAEANNAGEIILKNRHRCNLPLLLMHGSLDKVTSCRATAEFAEYTSEKTTFKLWDGDYHELHNEFDKEKVFGYILEWIKNVSSTQRFIYGNL